jgi:transposase
VAAPARARARAPDRSAAPARPRPAAPRPRARWRRRGATRPSPTPPTLDPELMIRMLIIGYVFAIRSERAICRDVQVNPAYRWFCGLSEDKIPDHSAFSRARHERFRDSDMFRRVFERVVEACIAAGLVGGEGFAVDASLIVADANKQRSIPGSEWNKARDPRGASRLALAFHRDTFRAWPTPPGESMRIDSLPSRSFGIPRFTSPGKGFSCGNARPQTKEEGICRGQKAHLPGRQNRPAQQLCDLRSRSGRSAIHCSRRRIRVLARRVGSHRATESPGRITRRGDKT